MCLLYYDEFMYWNEANKYCVSRGGHLVWFENKAEHALVNKYVRKKKMPARSYFHIGLHRAKNGSLQWTGGSKSSYRGNPFVDPKYKFFSANSDWTQIEGNLNILQPFLCRRA